MVEFRGRGVLAVDAGTGTDVAHVEITHHLWLDWSRIARTHLLHVRDARAEALRVRDAGGNWAEPMEGEYMNALVVIAACGHALDGLYGALKSMVPSPALNSRASRHDYIRAVLGAAFRLSNAEGRRWRAECTWLYDLRDAAVHPEEVSRPTVPHPVEGAGSYEASRYCMEHAERAVALVDEVLLVLASPDRGRNDEVRRYSEQMRQVVLDLLSQ